MGEWLASFEDDQEDYEYVIKHYVQKAAQAKKRKRVKRFLSNFEFINAKVSLLDSQSLIEDYDLALQPEVLISEETKEVFRLIQGAIRQSANVLQEDKTQLPGQLLGKLINVDNDAIEPFLEQTRNWKEYAWLRPLRSQMLTPLSPLVRTIATKHPVVPRAVAISPDGKFAVTAGYRDGVIKQWDLTTGRQVKVLEIKETFTKVRSPSNYPQPDEIIESISDEEVRKKVGISVLTISPDGNWLATGSSYTDSLTSNQRYDGIIRERLEPQTIFELWNLVEGESILCFAVGHKDRIDSIALSSNASHAVIGTARGNLLVIDLEKDYWRSLYFKMEEATTKADSNQVGFVPGKTKKIPLPESYFDDIFQDYRFWNYPANRSSINIHSDMEEVKAVTISFDAHWMLAASDKVLKVWDLWKGCLHQIVPLKSLSPVKYLNITPDNYVNLLSEDGTISQIRLKSCTKKSFLTIDWSSYLNSLKLLLHKMFPKKILIINRIFDEISEIFSDQKHKNLLKLHYEHPWRITYMEYIFGSIQNFFKRQITNLLKRRSLPINKLPIKLPYGIIPDAITPDCQWMVSRTNDGGIQVWNPSNLQQTTK